MKKKYEDLTRKEIIQLRKEIMNENESLKKQSVIIIFCSVMVVLIPSELLFSEYKNSFLVSCIITAILASTLWRVILSPQYTKLIKQKLENKNT